MASATDAEEALRATHGKENCQRLNRLLMRGGVSLLKEKFDSFHSPTDLPLKLGDPATQAQLKRAKISKPEWDCLYPSPGTFGKSTDFDITLTFRLLRTICNLTPPLTGWDNLPNSADQSLEADFARIKYYRNTVYGHNKKMEITNSEFCQHWKEIRDVLLRIAGSISSAKRDEWKMSIDGLLHDPLTPEAQRYVDELQLWYKKDMDVKDGIERVEDGQKQMNVHIRSQNQQMNQMNQRQVEMNQRQVEMNQRQVEMNQRQVEMNQRLETFINIHVEGNRQDLPANIWTVILSFKEQIDGFLEYLKDQLRVTIASLGGGSLLITVTCSSLQILEGLWADYCSGHLNKVAEQKLVTPDVLERLRLSDLKLKTTISDEEYQKCKEFFMRADQKYKYVPQTTQEKGIPLCLPNNLSWDPLTGEIQKTSDERCSLHPVPAAVKMLQEIKEPVCVVSIAGPCRDGKSYILGEVFGQMEVFPIGHMVDPETMGLWMWIVPQKFQDSRGRDFRVILLDSEGINAVTAADQNDNQIFTLTVLLASVMIYNSKGVPKRNDLNDLDFIAHLSQRIRIRSKGDRDGQDLFRNTFPFFIWLLRDVTQRLPPDCRDYNQFFSTRVFKDSKTSASDDEKQQKVAESILSFFSGFESFALPIPSSDPDVMQDIGKHRDKLAPNFLEGVKRFESLLKSKLFPKRSINQGEYVTGEALGTLIELYTDAINDPDAIPNMETAWDTHVRKTLSKAKKRALKIYDQVMTQLMSSRLPCEVDEILKNHDISQRQSMETFEAKTAELISTIIGNELRQFTKLIDEKISFWRDKNASLTQKFCEDLLVKLKREHLDPVLERVRGPDGAKVKYVDIMTGWSKIKNDFKSKAVGSKDVRAEVFFKFNQYLQEEVMKYEEILRKMQDYNENLSKEKIARAYQEKEKRKLEENLAAMAKQEEAWQRKMDMLEKRQQDELQLIKEQAKVDKEALDKQMQIVKDADMKAQAKLKKQLEIVVENEKQANKALQEMKQLFEKSKNDANAEKKAANLKLEKMQAESTKAMTQLQGQLSAISVRETQTNKRFNDMMRVWEEDRKEAAAMRNDIRTLTNDLTDANKPGFIRRVWRKIF